MSELKIQELEGELVIDSRLIARNLDILHRSFMKTIDRYREEIEEFGVLRLENSKPFEGSQGGRPERFCYLNENQSTYVMTLSRNTDQVRRCKRKLVKVFAEAKKIISQVIPAQSERIRELELQVELAKQNNNWVENVSLLSQLHGAATTMALLGREEAVVKVEKPTLEIIDERYNVKFSGQTLRQVGEFLQQKYGIKFKPGEVKKRLQALKREDIIAQTPRSILTDYIPTEYLEEAYQLLISGNRQLLLGE